MESNVTTILTISYRVVRNVTKLRRTENFELTFFYLHFFLLMNPMCLWHIPKNTCGSSDEKQAMREGKNSSLNKE